MLIHKHFTSVVQYLHNLYTWNMQLYTPPANYLKDLGLTTDEVCIYLSLLELGSMTISELSRRSGVERTALYRNLPSLQQKQLIMSEEDNKRSIITALPPDRFLQVLEEERLRLNKLESRKTEFMSEIQRLENNSSEIFTHAYRGIEAVKQIMLNSLNSKMNTMFSMQICPFESIIETEFMNKINESRAKKQITNLVVYSDNLVKGINKLNNKAATKISNAKFYYIRPDQFEISQQIDSYDDRIIYYFFEETPHAVEIQGKSIASTTQKTIEMLSRLADTPRTINELV